jgi:hypothetical protein
VRRSDDTVAFHAIKPAQRTAKELVRDGIAALKAGGKAGARGEILGHSQISITADIYGHVLPAIQRQALDLMGLALESDEPCEEED